MIGLFLLMAAASGVQSASSDCRDDRGADRCAPSAQAKMLELYGVPSVEEHARRGDQVRRTFYVDGYGRDLIAISFVRSPGRDPVASVYFPRSPNARAIQSLEAAVPHRAWANLLRRSELFDRALAPKPTDPEAVNICMHSWVFVVEANDPARANSAPASLRRTTEDACSHGPAQAFAVELQQAALPLFAHCDRLDPAKHRNPASQLGACRLLTGDRMAAAEVMNRADALPRFRSPSDREQIAGLFSHSVSIDWAGERRTLGMIPAGQFWADKLLAVGGANFYFERVEGLSADRVRLTGAFSRSEDSPGGEGRSVYYRAPVELTWQFGPSQQWEIIGATVGAWEQDRP